MWTMSDLLKKIRNEIKEVSPKIDVESVQEVVDNPLQHHYVTRIIDHDGAFDIHTLTSFDYDDPCCSTRIVNDISGGTERSCPHSKDWWRVPIHMVKQNSKCPICGSSGEDLVFKFYCVNKACRNYHL